MAAMKAMKAMKAKAMKKAMKAKAAAPAPAMKAMKKWVRDALSGCSPSDQGGWHLNSVPWDETLLQIDKFV